MTHDINSMRRRFLKGSALVAPIAATPLAAAAHAADGLEGRVQRLEDEAALRELHQSWLRGINAGLYAVPQASAVRRITADHTGAPDRIEVAADGRRAVGYFDHAVEVETTLAPDCTLTQMAHAQGSGTLRRRERRLLSVDYLKIGGTWRIDKVALTAPEATGL